MEVPKLHKGRDSICSIITTESSWLSLRWLIIGTAKQKVFEQITDFQTVCYKNFLNMQCLTI